MTPQEVKAQETLVSVSNALSSAGFDDAAAFVLRPWIKATVEDKLND